MILIANLKQLCVVIKHNYGVYVNINFLSRA